MTGTAVTPGPESPSRCPSRCPTRPRCRCLLAARRGPFPPHTPTSPQPLPSHAPRPPLPHSPSPHTPPAPTPAVPSLTHPARCTPSLTRPPAHLAAGPAGRTRAHPRGFRTPPPGCRPASRPFRSRAAEPAAPTPRSPSRRAGQSEPAAAPRLSSRRRPLPSGSGLCRTSPPSGRAAPAATWQQLPPPAPPPPAIQTQHPRLAGGRPMGNRPPRRSKGGYTNHEANSYQMANESEGRAGLGQPRPAPPRGAQPAVTRGGSVPLEGAVVAGARGRRWRGAAAEGCRLRLAAEQGRHSPGWDSATWCRESRRS